MSAGELVVRYARTIYVLAAPFGLLMVAQVWSVRTAWIVGGVTFVAALLLAVGESLGEHRAEAGNGQTRSET